MNVYIWIIAIINTKYKINWRIPSKTFRPNKSRNPNLNPTELRHPRQNSASVSASVSVGTHFLQIVTIPTCGSDLNSDHNRSEWCQFRLVQTRIQRRIPTQKTHQDSAKGRKGCEIPSSSDSDSEVDSDPKDAPIIKRTEMVRIQLRNQILKGTSTIWGDGIDAGFSYGIRSWKQ